MLAIIDAMVDTLHLFKDAYPLDILVSSEELAGQASVMAFTLPRHGHNLPLRHAHEEKAVFLLSGTATIRTDEGETAPFGEHTCAWLRPGRAHVIRQAGETPARVMIVLMPGAVEAGFREAANCPADQKGRAAIEAALKRFDVIWDMPRGRGSSHGVELLERGTTLKRMPFAIQEHLVKYW